MLTRQMRLLSLGLLDVLDGHLVFKKPNLPVIDCLSMVKAQEGHPVKVFQTNNKGFCSLGVKKKKRIAK